MTHRQQFEKAYDFGYNHPDAELEQFVTEHRTWGFGDVILLAHQFLHGQTCRALDDYNPYSAEKHNSHGRRITDAIRKSANA